MTAIKRFTHFKGQVNGPWWLIKIQNQTKESIPEKERFKTREQVRSWLDSHLKGQIQTLLDFKAWDEWHRRAVNAYMQISNVT
jgi:hypothetical protein